jgi:hypothetical protein
VPDSENRDLRQLLWHRHRLVQMRTRVMNQLHVVALNEGLRRKKAPWRPAGRAQLAGLSVTLWASRRRQDLLDLLDRLTPKIHELTGKLAQIVERRPVTRQLSTHPGVGPADGTGVRVSDRNAGTLPVREANRQLRGVGAGARIQRRPERAGPHQQAGQRAVALPAGESRAGDGAQRSAMAQPVFSPGHAARTEDRQGRDGEEAGGRVYWMLRRGWDYDEMQKLGSQGRKSGSHAGVPTASTRYPRLRSSRIIRLVRLRLDFAFPAGPGSS